MDWNQDQPIYLQLRQHIIYQILAGSLAEGDLIPSIRQTSLDYQINPLTVSKAYQSLVDGNVLEKQRGVGMRIINGAQRTLRQQERQHFLNTQWPQLKIKLKQLNLNLKELLDD
jgi:GntR family transcriptional regulator